MLLISLDSFPERLAVDLKNSVLCSTSASESKSKNQY